MSLQEWFYIFGIIFMVVFIALMISIGVIFFLLYQRVTSLQRLAVNRLGSLVEPAEIAISTGAKVARNAANKVRDILENRKK